MLKRIFEGESNILIVSLALSYFFKKKKEIEAHQDLKKNKLFWHKIKLI